jgi:hypothetical protein
VGQQLRLRDADGTGYGERNQENPEHGGPLNSAARLRS